jgi:hypothetical protein
MLKTANGGIHIYSGQNDSGEMQAKLQQSASKQRRNEGLPEMQRANQCGSLLFKLFILNAPFD